MTPHPPLPRTPRLHRENRTTIRRRPQPKHLIIVRALRPSARGVLGGAEVELLVGKQGARELVGAEAGGEGFLEAVGEGGPGGGGVGAEGVGVDGYG